MFIITVEKTHFENIIHLVLFFKLLLYFLFYYFALSGEFTCSPIACLGFLQLLLPFLSNSKHTGFPAGYRLPLSRLVNGAPWKLSEKGCENVLRCILHYSGKVLTIVTHNWSARTVTSGVMPPNAIWQILKVEVLILVYLLVNYKLLFKCYFHTFLWSTTKS